MDGRTLVMSTAGRSEESRWREGASPPTANGRVTVNPVLVLLPWFNQRV